MARRRRPSGASPTGAPRPAPAQASFDPDAATIGGAADSQAATRPRASRPTALGGGDAPAQLGRHAVEGELGRGGMGVVMRVTDPHLARPVAAKVALGDSPAQLARFVREAQVTGMLQHPGVVPVHELGRTASGAYFFTMKEVLGRELTELLLPGRRGQRTPLGRLLQVFLRVCETVNFAHSRGVIHRDLKPDNIMVGDFGEVLVLDWGLAKVDGMEELASSISALDPRADQDTVASLVGAATTVDGTIQGTPAYMPPEQAEGRVQDVDARSDVYALGAILYEMLCGQPPHSGGTALEVLAQIGSPVTPPSERAPERGVPWELEAVAMRALEPAPDDRYPSVDQLLDEVTRYVEGGLLQTASYSSWQRLRKWAARHRASLLAGGAVAALAIALLGGLAYQQASERRAAIEARRAAARAAVGELPDEPALASELAQMARRLQAGESVERGAYADIAGAYRRAIAELTGALMLAPDDAALIAERARCGRALAWAQAMAGDLTPARQSLDELADYGGAPSAQPIEQLAAAVLVYREAALEKMLADLDGGLQKGRHFDGWRLEDYVYAALRFRDPQTVRILGQRIEALTRDTAADRIWALGERLVFRFACGVLGRLGVEGSQLPLARAAARVGDPDMARELGLALCATRDRRVVQPLLALLSRTRSSELTEALAIPMRQLPLEQAAGQDGSLEQRTRAVEALSAAGRHEAALARIDAQPDRDDVRWLHERGRVLHAMGRLDEAERVFTDLIRRPQLAESLKVAALANRGNVRRHQGRLSDALSDYERAISLRPGMLELRVYLNVIALMREMSLFQRAEAVLRHARRFHDSPDLRYEEGRLALVQGDHDAAIRSFAAAIEANAQEARYHISLGQARMGKRLPKAALDDFQRAIDLDNDLIEARVGYVQCLYELGKVEQAARMLEETAAAHPDNPYVLALLASTQRKRGRYDDAVETARRAVEASERLREGSRLHRSTWRAYQELTYALLYAGRHELALEAAETLVTECGDRRAIGFKARGHVLEHLNRPDDALADYRRALRLTPRDGGLLNNVGVVLARQGKLDEAIAAFDKAIAAVPHGDEAIVNRAQALSTRDRLPEALRDLERVIERGGLEAWRAHMVRAQIRYRAGQHQVALADLDAAIRGAEAAQAEGPRRAELHMTRGVIHHQAKALKRAEADYRQAIALDARQWNAMMNLGLLLANTSREAEASRVLRRARALAAASPDPAVRPFVQRIDEMLRQLE